MNKEIKDKWVKALKSGDYAQGRDYLCRMGGRGASYCCLGVLAEIVGGEKIWIRGSNGVLGAPISPSSSASLKNMPPEWLRPGIDSRTAAELAKMNDDGTDFGEIADWIDENIVGAGNG